MCDPIQKDEQCFHLIDNNRALLHALECALCDISRLAQIRFALISEFNLSVSKFVIKGNSRVEIETNARRQCC